MFGAPFRAYLAAVSLPVALCAIVACSDGPTGADGQDGQDGTDALVVTTPEPAGGNCTNGGTKVDVGVDDNGDGALDASEVTSTSYVCNGGTGSGGHDSLVVTTPESAGANCPFGGTRIDSALD